MSAGTLGQYDATVTLLAPDMDDDTSIPTLTAHIAQASRSQILNASRFDTVRTWATR